MQTHSDPLRVGIGGPVGSGKTALTLALCRRLRRAVADATVPPLETAAATYCSSRPKAEQFEILRNLRTQNSSEATAASAQMY